MNEHPVCTKDPEPPEQLHQQLQAAVETRDTGELAALIRKARQAADEYLAAVSQADACLAQARREAEELLERARREAREIEESARVKSEYYWDSLSQRIDALFARQIPPAPAPEEDVEEPEGFGPDD